MGIENRLMKVLAIKLYLEGLNQKQISTQIHISEKTVGKWLKELKKSIEKNKGFINKLKDRLENLLNEENPNTTQIKNITTSLSHLENLWFNRIIKK